MTDKQWFDHIAEGQPRQTMSNKQIDEALEALNSIGRETPPSLGTLQCRLEKIFHREFKVIRATLERQRVPEGWKLVPINPTKEQRQIGGETNTPSISLTDAGMYAEEVYRAMLAAAPEPDDNP